MRILIADDHILIRAGLKQLIESFGNYEVVAEATTGKEALQLLEQSEVDVLLLDISMPDESGLDVLKRVRAQWPELRVLMLSMHSDTVHVKTALENGANGFLVKDSAPTELYVALNATMRGQKYISPSVSEGLLDAWLRPEPNKRSDPRLSPRQQEILDLIGEGFSTKEIAARLNLSTKTIETHRARMMETLGLNRGPELLRYALKQQQQES